jgi:hypothetical protein
VRTRVLQISKKIFLYIPWLSHIECILQNEKKASEREKLTSCLFEKIENSCVSMKARILLVKLI